MRSIVNTLDKGKPVFDRVYQLVMFFCKLLLSAEIMISSWVVFCRLIGSRFGLKSPAWGEEIILSCMIYMALIGASMGIRRNAHIRMTALDRFLPQKAVLLLDLLADVLVLSFALVMIIVGWSTATGVGSKGFYISLPSLSKFWMFVSVPVAGACMALFELETFYLHLKQLLLKEEI